MADRRGMVGLILIFLIIVGDIITGVSSIRAPFNDQASECVGPVWACLPNHVHTPNAMILTIPTWSPDPFTTTSVTPVALPGLLANIKQQNATHGVWFLILVQLTVKITPTGIGNIQLECDGVSCGSGGSFSAINYETISLFLMQNNTFVDNQTHVIGVDVSSDSVAHTVSVCATDSDCFASGLGNFVSLMSIADLSSAGPT